MNYDSWLPWLPRDTVDIPFFRSHMYSNAVGRLARCGLFVPELVAVQILSEGHPLLQEQFKIGAERDTEIGLYSAGAAMSLDFGIGMSSAVLNSVDINPDSIIKLNIEWSTLTKTVELPFMKNTD